MSFKDGYDTVIGERGVTLSGGQRQRLAIARALLTDPRILILDDSTSAIDSATEDKIQQAIHRVLEGRTTLLITHRLSMIRRADLILMLDKGRIVDIGAHEALDGAESAVSADLCEVLLMGFLMDGLEAEGYDRSYSDRQLSAASSATSARTWAR
jgi:ABC-type multidrug transport system fused ATPase/permease subunit